MLLGLKGTGRTSSHLPGFSGGQEGQKGLRALPGQRVRGRKQGWWECAGVDAICWDTGGAQRYCGGCDAFPKENRLQLICRLRDKNVGKLLFERKYKIAIF